MHFAALAVFVSTLCAIVSATPVPQTKLYRGSDKRSGAVPNNLRLNDFKVENDQIQPDLKKGFSTNKDRDLNGLPHRHLWSVDSSHLDNHATLKAVHDGKKGNLGHVTIAHHGAPASPQDVRGAIAGLPWQYEGPKPKAPKSKVDSKPSKAGPSKPKPDAVKRELYEDWDALD